MQRWWQAWSKVARRLSCKPRSTTASHRVDQRPAAAGGEPPRPLPPEQAVLKGLYLAIISLDPTGKGRKRWTNRWKVSLNAFAITFDGRVTAGRK
jgi:hypothetical protein